MSTRRRAAKPLLVLGLDPGSRFTGYALLRLAGGKIDSVASGRIKLPAKAPLADRLGRLAASLETLLGEHSPDVAVLETPFHGVNTKSLVVLAQARGALLASLARSGIETREYSPAEVKTAVTGSGRADKDQVAKMVGLHLRLDVSGLSADETDALAIAICYAHRSRLDRLSSR